MVKRTLFLITAISTAYSAHASNLPTSQLSVAYDVSNHVMYAAKKISKPGDVISVIDTKSEKELATIALPVSNSEGERVQIALDQNKNLQIITESSQDEMIEVAKAVSLTQNAPKDSGKFTKGSSLGFSAGFMSGVGFAFRKFYGNGMGFNIAAGAMATQSGSDISTGLELMKTIDETDYFRFFAVAGAGFHKSMNKYTVSDKDTDPMNPNPVMVETKDKSSVINAGIGLGVEYAPAGMQKKGIALSLDCAYAVRFEKNDNYYEGSKPMKYVGLAPLPNFSIIYYFNR